MKRMKLISKRIFLDTFSKKKIFFFQLFHKIDDAKRDKLIKLLYKTESLMRTSFNKNKEIGMRFLLNFKKIIVS